MFKDKVLSVVLCGFFMIRNAAVCRLLCYEFPLNLISVFCVNEFLKHPIRRPSWISYFLPNSLTLTLKVSFSHHKYLLPLFQSTMDDQKESEGTVGVFIEHGTIRSDFLGIILQSILEAFLRKDLKNVTKLPVENERGVIQRKTQATFASQRLYNPLRTKAIP